MDTSSLQDQIGAAVAMLDVFASVGATSFDITHRNLAGEKRGFRPRQPVTEARRSMPYLIRNAPARQNNVIVRPEPYTRFIQLDDLNAEQIETVRPAAFLILTTSPHNFQAWLAVEDLQPFEHKEFARRVRKGAGADVSASGATRVAGSFNFKPKYAPEFPTVAVLESHGGRTTTKAELEALGIVAPAEPEPAAMPPRQVSRVGKIGPKKWPSYERCLAQAPAGKNHDHGEPDRSAADYVWCMIALDWGFTPEATAAQLLRVSDHAKGESREYAAKTVYNAGDGLRHRAKPTKTPSGPSM